MVKSKRISSDRGNISATYGVRTVLDGLETTIRGCKASNVYNICREMVVVDVLIERFPVDRFMIPENTKRCSKANLQPYDMHENRIG